VSRRWLPWLAVAGYAVALALLLARHEPWRDEIQAWLLARDSPTLGDLWRNTRYEGHPLLWHVLLWLLARFTHDPEAMQGLHWLFAVATAATTLFLAPFPFAVRAAWVLGYLPFYEYGVVSRNYAPTALFLTLAVAWEKKRAWPWLLALAAHSSPMGVLLVPPLWWALEGRGRPLPWTGRFALAASWLLAAFACWPPADYAHARGVFLGWDARRAYYVLRGYASAFLPLPRPGVHFWNDPWLFPFPWDGVWTATTLLGAALAVVVLLLTSFWLLERLSRQRRIALAYLASQAVLFGFFYAKFPGAMRHHGFFFLVATWFLWLAVQGAVADRPAAWTPAVPVLAVGLAGSLVAGVVDWRLPFSTGKAMAQAVRARCGEALLVAHPDWAGSTVAGFLPGKRLFYLTRNAFGTFVVWDLARAAKEPLEESPLLEAVGKLAAGQDVCLILNRALRDPGVEMLAALSPAVVSDEEMVLYRVPRGTP
jgi:hypothetical protein